MCVFAPATYIQAAIDGLPSVRRVTVVINRFHSFHSWAHRLIVLNHSVHVIRLDDVSEAYTRRLYWFNSHRFGWANIDSNSQFIPSGNKRTGKECLNRSFYTTINKRLNVCERPSREEIDVCGMDSAGMSWWTFPNENVRWAWHIFFQMVICSSLTQPVVTAMFVSIQILTGNVCECYFFSVFTRFSRSHCAYSIELNTNFPNKMNIEQLIVRSLYTLITVSRQQLYSIA